MKIVLCNGDSLGMPRDKVSFHSTWYYRLSNRLSKKEYYFVNNFKRSNTTKSLNSRDSLENYNPDIVIIQLGIVDCAPRLYNPDSIFIKIVNRLPSVLKNNFWNVSKIVKKRSSQNAEVVLDEFEKNIESFLNRCLTIGVEKCVIVKIQTPGAKMIEKNPDIVDAIRRYNNVFDKMENIFHIVRLVDPLFLGEDCDYISDGYHLNEKGFGKVYGSLIEEFKQC